MSAGGLSVGVEDTVAPTSSRLSPTVYLFIAVAAIAVVSLVRVFTGADDLTSSGTVAAALTAAVPIALAGLGGLWSERAGGINIGLEGMMVLGTWGAGFAGYQWGPWAGVVLGVLLGAFGGLVHAVATVTFGVDHIISGVAIPLVAPGLTLFLAKLYFAKAPGGGQKQSPPIPDVARVTVPGLSSALGDLEAKHWFFVSDLAGVLRGLITDLSLLSLLAVVLFVITGYVLWRTPFGLRLRSWGEAPFAAESLGVNVYRYKYAAIVASGALAGLGGAILAINSSQFRDGQTGGRGYIGLASMIFGNWRPGGGAAGSGSPVWRPSSARRSSPGSPPPTRCRRSWSAQHRTWSRCWCFPLPHNGFGYPSTSDRCIAEGRADDAGDRLGRPARERCPGCAERLRALFRVAGRRRRDCRRRPRGAGLQCGERVVRARPVRRVHDGRETAAVRRRASRRGRLPQRRRRTAHAVWALPADPVRAGRG